MDGSVARWSAVYLEHLQARKLAANSLRAYRRDLESVAGELAEHLVRPEQLREHAERLCALIESAPRAKRQKAELPQDLTKIVAAQRLRAALLPLLDRRSRAGCASMAGIYHQVLQAIAAEPLRAMRRRTSLSSWQKAGVAARSMAGIAP